MSANMSVCTHRRPAAAARWLRALLIAAAGLLASAAHGAGFQNLDTIRQAVNDFLVSQAQGHFPGKVSVEVGYLDNRLRLPACDRPLDAAFAPGRTLTGATTVSVHCEGSAPWSVNVGARLHAYGNIVIAANSLRRGQAVRPDDVEVSQADVASLGRGYFTSLDQVKRLVMLRSVRVGTVLTPSMLRQPLAVRRGDQVTITASAGALEVRAKGTAMADGARGDRIGVRNSSSRRVVEGTITAPGTVRVDL